MMAARGRRANERAGPAGKEKRKRTWDGGGRYFIYRPPLGLQQPSDHACTAMILKDFALTWSFSSLAAWTAWIASMERAWRGGGGGAAGCRRAGGLSTGFWAPVATVPFSAARKSNSMLACSSIDFRQQGCSSIRAEARSTVKCLQ